MKWGILSMIQKHIMCTSPNPSLSFEEKEWWVDPTTVIYGSHLEEEFVRCHPGILS